MKFTAVKAIIFPKRYLPFSATVVSASQWTIGIRDGGTAVCSDLSATGINFHIPLNHKIEAIKASLASHYTSTCRSFIICQHRSFPSLSSPLLLSSLIFSPHICMCLLTGWDLIFDRIPTSLTQIKVSNI